MRNLYWAELTAVLSLLLASAGCQDIDSEPPTFEGAAKAVAVSDAQAAVFWRAGRDDLNAPAELRYGLWFGENSVELDRDPDVITQEGALSYHLKDLQADAVYRVVVRAMDRGDHESTNSDSLTVRTTTTQASPFERVLDVPMEADLMVGLRLLESQPAIGVIDERRVDWYGLEDGTFLRLSDISSLDLEQAPIEAFSASIQSDHSTEDLLILSTNGLLLYLNREGRFQEPTQIDPVPVKDSLAIVDLNDDAHLDLAYVTSFGEIVLLEGDGDGVFVLRLALIGSGEMQHMRVADLDADDLVDLIIYGNAGLEIFFGEGEGFDVLPPELVDDPVPDTRDLLVGDFDGDTDIDLLLWVSPPDSEHELRLYRNDGDGDFDSALVIAMDEGRYVTPQAWTGEGAAGLGLLQPASNNAVLFTNLVGGVDLPVPLLGGVDEPSELIRLDLDLNGSVDWILASQASERLMIAFRR